MNYKNYLLAMLITFAGFPMYLEASTLSTGDEKPDPSLEVEMTNSSIRQSGEYVELMWTLKTNFSTERIELERLSQKGNWQQIGIIRTTGPGEKTPHYFFLDTNPSELLLEYRLKLIGYDGASVFTALEATNEDMDGTSSSVLIPKKVNDILTVNFNEPVSITSVSIINHKGKKVYGLRPGLFDKKSVSLNLTLLSAGEYTLIIQKSGEVIRENFFKQ
ncbi:MAG: hypothetical protein AAF502_24990 [Bacteroidota bacterium]